MTFSLLRKSCYKKRQKLSYFTKKLRELLLQKFIQLTLSLLSQANLFLDYWSELSLDIPFIIKFTKISCIS